MESTRNWGLRQRMSEATRPLYGVVTNLSDPAVVEIVHRVGFDWVGIEMEHGPHGLPELENFQRTAEATGLASVVKLSIYDEHLLRKVLDTGVDCVLLAGARDVSAVRATVAGCRFPPRGTRSVSTIVRGGGYGGQGLAADHLAARNEAIVVGVIAETPELVSQIEDLMTVDGLDFVLVGTADLSVAMGVGSTSSLADLEAAVNRILDACDEASVSTGMPLEHPAFPLTSSELAERNINIAIATTDVRALLNGLAAAHARTV